MWHEEEYLIINGYIQEKQIIFLLFYDLIRPFIYSFLCMKGLFYAYLENQTYLV